MAQIAAKVSGEPISPYAAAVLNEGDEGKVVFAEWFKFLWIELKIEKQQRDVGGGGKRIRPDLPKVFAWAAKTDPKRAKLISIS